MKKIIFTNVAYLGNAGDYWSSPVKYYSFPNINVHQIHFLDFTEAMNKRSGFEEYDVKNQIIVVGGGGLITTNGDYLQNTLEYLAEKNKIIFWGAGTNTFKKPKLEIFSHPNVILSGVRDFLPNENFLYVPCVSCKHSLFDKKYYINDEIGLIEHPEYFIDIPNISKISNSDSIDNIIKFISSKEVIITSTYHGIYWSQIMNKKVLYYKEDNIINSKFLNLKHRVPICNKKNFYDLINSCSYVSNMKEESRYLNDLFLSKIMELI